MKGQAPSFTMPAGLSELMAALEREWPAMQANLRACGTPLNDEAPPEPPAPAPPAPAPPAPVAPPWGDDADFDPEKAWKLIQNVRGDADKLKQERDALAQRVQAHDDATKTEQQKLEERATTAETAASTATSEAARLRVALKKGLTETQAKRLVGTTEEELEADADELLASFKTEDDDGQDPLRRPRERLRPGAVPSSEAEENDPLKLAAQVPRI